MEETIALDPVDLGPFQDAVEEGLRAADADHLRPAREAVLELGAKFGFSRSRE